MSSSPRARHLGIPARYVSGYLYRTDRPTARRPGTPGPRPSSTASAGSASTRANASARPRRYVRVAIGLDYLGAAPVRGTRYGGGGEELAVRILIGEATRGQR